MPEAPSPDRPNAVACVVRRRDGRYLLIRRAEGIPAPGYWSPITGRPLPDEELAVTAVREVAEEIGLEVIAGEVVHRSWTDDRAWFLHWFETEPIDAAAPFGELSPDPAEVADFTWLTAAEAARLEPMFPTTRQFFLDRVEPEN